MGERAGRVFDLAESPGDSGDIDWTKRLSSRAMIA
jgi:hypothetical protein